ncbi:Rossmann-like and DUF2520 domain-containing protein [Novosphingobium sp.]|uniref:Rossmann-like and DUF2520 domain-containing protein n=1 Tax=Novosphingobium sp. TaxID=1874826 RepID=UPI00352A3160
MAFAPSIRRIGIIGTGRVARALALGFARHATVTMWGRSPDKLAAIAGVETAETCAVLMARSDVVAICVADDAIAALVEDLALGGACSHAPLVFHVCGRSGAALLAPLREKGALTAAIHPAMTFTGDPAQEVRRMAGAPFAITAADSRADARAREVVAMLGGVAVPIAEEHRTLYHAALSHAANHLVTLIAGASAALRAAGVNTPGALLAPLVHASLENSLTGGFSALSGPLLRGDADTVHGHIDAMRRACPAVLPAYRAMALATLDELERQGAPAQDALREDLSG